MPQFLVTLYDGTDAEAPARRQATRPAHLDGLKGNVAAGRLVFGGPIFDDAQTADRFVPAGGLRGSRRAGRDDRQRSLHEGRMSGSASR